MEARTERTAERRILEEVAGLDGRLLKPSYVSDRKLAQLFYRASEYGRACRMRTLSGVFTAIAAAGAVAAGAMGFVEFGLPAFALAFGTGMLGFVSHSAANLNRRLLQSMGEDIRAFDDLVRQGRQDRGQSPAPAL